MNRAELTRRVVDSLDEEEETRVLQVIEDVYDGLEWLEKKGWVAQVIWSFVSPPVEIVPPHTMPITSLPGEGVAHALFEEGLASMFASIGAPGMHGGMYSPSMRGDRGAVVHEQASAHQPELPLGELRQGGAPLPPLSRPQSTTDENAPSPLVIPTSDSDVAHQGDE